MGLDRFKGPISRAPSSSRSRGTATRAARRSRTGDGIGASSYFAAAVGEYGVPARHERPSEPRPRRDGTAHLDERRKRQFIQANIGTLLPAWTDQTIYELTCPRRPTSSSGTRACQAGIGGYHGASTTVAKPSSTRLPHCSTEDKVTSASSHEIDEAVTDPLPRQPPRSAASSTSSSPSSSGSATTTERRRLRVLPRLVLHRGLTVCVQRPAGWSTSRAAGSLPCQPYTTAYWNVTPFDRRHRRPERQPDREPGYKAKLGDTIKSRSASTATRRPDRGRSRRQVEPGGQPR